MNFEEKKSINAHFRVGEKRKILGELILDRENSSLLLRDDEPFNIRSIEGGYLAGVLTDHKKISLLQCITLSTGSCSVSGSGRYHEANLFPHFAVLGERHLEPSDDKIHSVTFEIDDGFSLFYDFDAFATMIDPEAHIEKIAESDSRKIGRQIKAGSRPIIQYFTGNLEISRTDTAIGQIVVSHCPNYSLGGVQGVSIDNAIFIELKFPEPLRFMVVMEHLQTLLVFLKLALGRTQNVKFVRMALAQEAESSSDLLEVYWTHAPNAVRLKGERTPNPRDIPLWPVDKPDEYSAVLSTWIGKHPDLSQARNGILERFGSNFFDADRLVAAANMFDHIPPDSVPDTVELSNDLTAAQEQARQAFKSLPVSAERDSILGALGRLGKPTLKNRIRHRAKILNEASGRDYSELSRITDQAVDCRNHFVHGSPPRFDYDKHSNLTFFFSRTLEFVFCCSDLIECGWDMKEYEKAGSTRTHPFAQYGEMYKPYLGYLKEILSVGIEE